MTIKIRQLRDSEVTACRKQFAARQKYRCPICGGAIAHGVNALDHCFTEETELLTKGGFVKLNKISKTEEIAQWENRVISFVKPKEYVSRQFKGYLVNIENRSYSSLTTDLHRIPLIDRTTGNITVSTAASLPVGSRKYNIPRTGKYLEGCGINLTDDEVRLYVAIQADGCFTTGLRFRFKKARKIERMTVLLSNLNIPYTTHNTDCHQIYIGKADIPNYATKEFNISPSKFNMKQLNVFVDELGYWDGGKVGKTFQYSTTSYLNSEYVVSILTLAGLRCTKVLKKNKGNRADLYYINYGAKHEGESLRPLKSKLVPFEGKVTCPVVPSGFILIRHKGHISVSGNCHKTGMVRATLCRSCNQSEGKVLAGVKFKTPIGNLAYKDPVKWLRNLADYWEHHSAHPSGIIHPTFDLAKGKQKPVKRKTASKPVARKRAF